ATWYQPGGNYGVCGWPIGDYDYAVALSEANWAGGAHCGQDITVQYNGALINVVVADLCPGCAVDGIDLTLRAFETLADPDLGVIEVEWDFCSRDARQASRIGLHRCNVIR
ncbi:RlpA-like double-psi beta-barrel-protein domain-containing protein-containing protein, partial [Mycena latifolia]